MGYQPRNSFDEACSNSTESHCELSRRDRNIPKPADFGTSDPQGCLNACVGQILIGGDIEYFCQQLQLQRDDPKLLWSLYCCDYTNCGVWIDKPGQSPNVDLIINKCQNHGYYSIPDPGPPAWDSCSSGSPTNAQPNLPPGTIEPPDAGLRTFSRSSVPSMTSVPASPSSTSVPTLDSPIPSLSTDPPSSSSETESTGLTAGSKAAIGICTSLGVIALVSLLVFLIRRWKSDPRSYLKGDPVAPRHIRSFSEPPSGSRTSLIAPLMTPVPSASSRTAPCTPPARLSDRKYLGSCFNQDLPRSPATPGRPDDPAFPVSPIFAPTRSSGGSGSKLVPRHERRATTNSIGFPLPSSSPPAASAPHYPQSSIYSLSSGPGVASTTTFGSNNNNNNHNKGAGSMLSGCTAVATTSGTPPPPPPLSPSTRSLRPHDSNPLPPPPAPGEHALVAPSGPPPTRALPPPPPTPTSPPAHHSASPTFSVSPTSPTFPPPTARPIVLGGGSSSPPYSPRYYSHNNSNNNHHHHEGGPGLAARELCELTETYARETRGGSWGSWSAGGGCGGGGGGGGPGVSPIGGAGTGGGGRKRGSDGTSSRGSGDRKGAAYATAMALRELDLEKLGGRY
ncbi:hypothetical protein F4809DRAFT_665348 [Biscogniauxia mediterranea]|nr:hypothetical protein F4809DRAFT_665348 [Biscogniauxia mediterranea]